MLKRSIRKLFNDLERIGETHPELYDTDVREQLAETLDFAFVYGRRMKDVPVNFGMYSAEGDKRVAAAISAFLATALPLVKQEGIATGKARHDALQDGSIVSKQRRRFDSFIGSSAQPLNVRELPPYRFEEPDYD